VAVSGPTSRYTAVQMRHLFNTFMHHFINGQTTDHLALAWLLPARFAPEAEDHGV